MAYNKVIYGSNTLIDLTADTVSADTLAKNVIAHGADGNVITGSAEVTVSGETLIMPEGFISVS